MIIKIIFIIYICAIASALIALILSDPFPSLADIIANVSLITMIVSGFTIVIYVTIVFS